MKINKNYLQQLLSEDDHDQELADRQLEQERWEARQHKAAALPRRRLVGTVEEIQLTRRRVAKERDQLAKEKKV